MENNKFILTNDSEICFAFGFDETVSEKQRQKILSDCFDGIKKKLRKVILIKKGNEPLYKRIVIKQPKLWIEDIRHLPSPARIMNAIRYSTLIDKLIEAEKDPINKEILSIWATCRKRDTNPKSKTCGLVVKHFSQQEIVTELARKKVIKGVIAKGIVVSQSRVSRVINCIKQGGKSNPNTNSEGIKV